MAYWDGGLGEVRRGDQPAVFLVLQPVLFEKTNDINGLAERAACGSFCQAIDFAQQFRLGSRNPGCSISTTVEFPFVIE
jgi:hypothetical protein